MAQSVSLLGIPHDVNSSYLTGAALAPARIREAIHSPSANMWTETGVDLGACEDWHDAGDIAVTGLKGESAFTAIKAAATALLANEHRVLSFGGDHSVTWPLIEAHLDFHEDLNILQIDAHADLYADFDDNPYSHASVFARIMETKKVARLVQVGLRTLNEHQRNQAKRHGVEIYEMKDWRNVTALRFDGPLYVTIDLDGIDPAYAPGVSHIEPGGLTSRQVIDLIHRLDADLVGADIVELNPHRDVNGMTAMLAARLAKELSARLLEG